MPFAIDADDVPIDAENVTVDGGGIDREWNVRGVVGSWDVSRVVVDDDES